MREEGLSCQRLRRLFAEFEDKEEAIKNRYITFWKKTLTEGLYFTLMMVGFPQVQVGFYRMHTKDEFRFLFKRMVWEYMNWGDVKDRTLFP